MSFSLKVFCLLFLWSWKSTGSHKIFTGAIIIWNFQGVSKTLYKNKYHMLILFLVFYLQWKYELCVLFIIPIWTNSRKMVCWLTEKTPSWGLLTTLNYSSLWCSDIDKVQSQGPPRGQVRQGLWIPGKLGYSVTVWQSTTSHPCSRHQFSSYLSTWNPRVSFTALSRTQ